MARNDFFNQEDGYNAESIVTGFNFDGPAGGAATAPADAGLTVPPTGAFGDGMDDLFEDNGGSTVPDDQFEDNSTMIEDARQDVTGEKILPLAGWLVCVAGGAMGKDYRLHSGFNYIGRKEGLDVQLNDKKVDNEPSVQISYDAESSMFFVAKCGTPRKVSYVNGRPLLDAKELKLGDKIKMGDTELVFVPFCGENFNWPENETEE